MTLLDIYQAQLSAAKAKASSDLASYHSILPSGPHNFSWMEENRKKNAFFSAYQKDQAQVAFWQHQVDYWTPRLSSDAQLAVAVGQTLTTVQAQADQTILAGGSAAPRTLPGGSIGAPSNAGGSSTLVQPLPQGLPAKFVPGGYVPPSTAANDQKFINAGYVPPSWMGSQVGPQTGLPIQALQPKQVTASNASPQVTPPIPSQVSSGDPTFRSVPPVTAQSRPAGNVTAISAAQTGQVQGLPSLTPAQHRGNAVSPPAAAPAAAPTVVAAIPASSSPGPANAAQAASTKSNHSLGVAGLIGLAVSVIGALS